MKNLLSIITVAFMPLSLQASNYINPNTDDSIFLPSTFFDNNMNILSIKADLNRTYFMTGSFTVIKTPTAKQGDVAPTVDISFRNEVVISKPSNDYIQVNAQATRNDNNSINKFGIYIHHDGGTQGKIDKSNIKVNWKTGSIEVVAKLTNAPVIYQEDSILIIGTMQQNGYTIGVSLAIAKEVKLI